MNRECNASAVLGAALSGPELEAPELRALGELQPGLVTLFARNLRSPSQIRDLIAGIRETCEAPLLVALDQEGGAVNRLREPFPATAAFPPAREQARLQPSRLRALWEAQAALLAALGFDVDFAPVVDLDGGDGVNGVGARSYSTDPGTASHHAELVLDTLASAGLAGCLKHFPGLGETQLDTHRELARCTTNATRLWELHAAPYRALAEKAPLVMCAHAHFVDVVGESPCPGTFSPTLLRGWLRDRLGYEGVVVTDDLGMGAVCRIEASAGRRARRALDAGADLLLFCEGLDEAREARDTLVEALDAGDIDDNALAESRGRVDALTKKLRGRSVAPSPANATELAYAALVDAL